MAISFNIIDGDSSREGNVSGHDSSSSGYCMDFCINIWLFIERGVEEEGTLLASVVPSIVIRSRSSMESWSRQRSLLRWRRISKSCLWEASLIPSPSARYIFSFRSSTSIGRETCQETPQEVRGISSYSIISILVPNRWELWSRDAWIQMHRDWQERRESRPSWSRSWTTRLSDVVPTRLCFQRPREQRNIASNFAVLLFSSFFYSYSIWLISTNSSFYIGILFVFYKFVLFVFSYFFFSCLLMKNEYSLFYPVSFCFHSILYSYFLSNMLNWETEKDYSFTMRQAFVTTKTDLIGSLLDAFFLKSSRFLSLFSYCYIYSCERYSTELLPTWMNRDNNFCTTLWRPTLEPVCCSSLDPSFFLLFLLFSPFSPPSFPLQSSRLCQI